MLFDVRPAAAKCILHAQLQIDGTWLILSDILLYKKQVLFLAEEMFLVSIVSRFLINHSWAATEVYCCVLRARINRMKEIDPYIQCCVYTSESLFWSDCYRGNVTQAAASINEENQEQS